MDGRAYLPAGRKGFYYYHYRTDMMERHGVSEQQLADARSRAQASRASGKQPGPKRRRQMPANPLEDVPIADVSTFLRAWRVECPWLVVCKSVSMFTRCSVREYLKLLIDQTSRGQESLRQALQTRLGDHFAFQAAQRLSHGRMEEVCEQSGGEKWMMLIDKMDQNKTICPTIWSQLPTNVPRQRQEVDHRIDRVDVVRDQDLQATCADDVQ